MFTVFTRTTNEHFFKRRSNVVVAVRHHHYCRRCCCCLLYMSLLSWSWMFGLYLFGGPQSIDRQSRRFGRLDGVVWSVGSSLSCSILSFGTADRPSSSPSSRASSCEILNYRHTSKEQCLFQPCTAYLPISVVILNASNAQNNNSNNSNNDNNTGMSAFWKILSFSAITILIHISTNSNSWTIYFSWKKKYSWKR